MLIHDLDRYINPKSEVLLVEIGFTTAVVPNERLEVFELFNKMVNESFANMQSAG